MARPLRVHLPGALYHVVSRGNARQAIFLDADDYTRFLARLAVTACRFGVRCRAYGLMCNHFHLPLEPDLFPLSRMMHQLNSSYSQSFNRRHARVGHVLQGRFKSPMIDGDAYFRRALRYILRNPVHAGLVGDTGRARDRRRRARSGDARCLRAHGYTLREIGDFVRRPANTVWRRIRRTRGRTPVGNEKIQI